jgi:hypothetical protein
MDPQIPKLPGYSVSVPVSATLSYYNNSFLWHLTQQHVYAAAMVGFIQLNTIYHSS